MAYRAWVDRNKAAACFGCGSVSGLECHHVVELYPILAGLWKLYGNEHDVLSHALAMHGDDRVENVTLCAACHAKRHPGRSNPEFDSSVRVDNWTVVPRNLKHPFSHSVATSTGFSLGLVGFQVLLGIGWYVLNGHASSRIVEVNRRRLAELLGKAPGTSFNKSLDEALDSLSGLGTVIGVHRDGNDLELHLSSEYLEELTANPWFMPLDDVKTSNMCVLTLRWFLGTQSNRKTYKIGLDKLKTHLGITVRNPSMAAKAVRKACSRISWAKLEVSKGMCQFSISRKGATPVHSLRNILSDSVHPNHGSAA